MHVWRVHLQVRQAHGWRKAVRGWRAAPEPAAGQAGRPRVAQCEACAALWQVPKLLDGIAARTPQHRELLLRLAAAGLRAYAVLPPAHRLGSEAEFAARCGLIRPVVGLRLRNPHRQRTAWAPRLDCSPVRPGLLHI